MKRLFTLALAPLVGLLSPTLPATARAGRLIPPVLALADARSDSAGLAEDVLEQVDTALAGWHVKRARELLDGLGDAPTVRVKRGVLLAFEARYADAEATFLQVIAEGKLAEGGAAAQEATHYLGLVRGAQQALGGSITIHSEDGLVEAVFASDRDALLAPYLFAAMAKARTSVGEVIGVVPADPVRFEFLDAPIKLALVTPLTVENIRTTGTVGVTKYRRIMMITPRVMVYGYGWLDTAVHEYVHYVLTMRTDNQAPVWLQEGLAKLLETRWRVDTQLPLDPPIAFRLHRAIVSDNLVTLAQMYPSIAMLPSAERASLAYAEVETMLGLLHERKGSPGIEVLLDRVAAGDDAQTALALAWGSDFASFMREWKRVMKARTARGEDGELTGPEFKDGSVQPPPSLGDVFSHLGGGKARQHARLGTLLQARGHKVAAATQYEKARAADKRARKDPTLCKRLGRLYVEQKAFDKAAGLLDIAAAKEPEDANLAAAQGRAHLRSGDRAGAQEPLARAVRNNPFIPALHCDLALLAQDEATRAAENALCNE